MNLPSRWVQFLASEGLQSIHWANVGKPTAQDSQIMSYAREQGFIVFTHDLDFGALLAGALNGEDKEALLSDHYSPVPGCWEENHLVPEISAIASDSFKCKNPAEIQGSCFVVKSLEAALLKSNVRDPT